MAKTGKKQRREGDGKVKYYIIRMPGGGIP
jgi:hypothetical protein